MFRTLISLDVFAKASSESTQTMSSDSPSKGDEFYKKAESKITKWFGKDWEEGQELFMKAGAAYKVEKKWDRAGDAFMRAGDCATKAKDSAQACQAYTESAHAWKKIDLNKARGAIQVAITLNIENNRLGSAAKLEKEFAEALDQDGQADAAIQHFQKAHDYYFAEDQPAAAMACKVQIARIHGELDHFDICVQLYEEIGSKYASGPLKYQAKEFFVRALLCRCASVTEENRTEKSAEVEEAFGNYLITDVNLKHTREQEFCEMIIQAVEEGDMERFDEAINFLNELKMLDDWKTHVLLCIKKNFEDIK